MMRLFILSLAMATQLEAAARAQVMPKELQEIQQMQAALVAAQAKAMRRGDEAMSCQAIEKELVGSMNDPAIQAYAAKAGAIAEKQAAALEKQKAASLTPQAAMALAAGLAPGADFAALVAGAQAQQATAAQLQAIYMRQLVAIMPQLMRSQRLVQLAFVKQCSWAVGANPFAAQLPLDEALPQRAR